MGPQEAGMGQKNFLRHAGRGRGEDPILQTHPAPLPSSPQINFLSVVKLNTRIFLFSIYHLYLYLSIIYIIIIIIINILLKAEA